MENAITMRATVGSGTSWPFTRPLTPCQIEKPPPIVNRLTATSSPQKKRALPWPNGCPSSGGRSARLRPNSSSAWLPVSAAECSASASIAADPEINAAANLAIAIAVFANSAASTLRRGSCESPLCPMSEHRTQRDGSFHDPRRGINHLPQLLRHQHGAVAAADEPQHVRAAAVGEAKDRPEQGHRGRLILAPRPHRPKTQATPSRP